MSKKYLIFYNGNTNKFVIIIIPFALSNVYETCNWVETDGFSTTVGYKFGELVSEWIFIQGYI